MKLKESKMLNIILIVAVVILFLIYWMNYPTLSRETPYKSALYVNAFVSIGLIAVSTVLYFKWMPLLENANPCVSGNGDNFLKIVALVVVQLWTISCVAKNSPMAAALLLGLSLFLWISALPIFNDSVDNGISSGLRLSLKLFVAIGSAVVFFLATWLISIDCGERPFSAYQLWFAVAALLFVLGYMSDRAWPPLFYSIGLIIVVWTLSFGSDWVPMADRFPDEYLYKLILSIIVQLAAIYWVSKHYPLLGALIFGLSLCGWMNVAPVEHVDSDPAGAGMARGFLMIAHIFLSAIFSIVFLLLLKFVKSNAVLPICVALLGIYMIHVLHADIGICRSRDAEMEALRRQMESSNSSYVPTQKKQEENESSESTY